MPEARKATDWLVAETHAGHHLAKKEITKPLEAGVWAPDEKFESNARVYFTCPHAACARINRTQPNTRDRSTTCYTHGFLYFSVFCESCGRHLWIHLEGFGE